MSDEVEKELTSTKQLMGALVRMKPKQHEEMKLGKNTRVKAASPAKKRTSRRASRASAKSA